MGQAMTSLSAKPSRCSIDDRIVMVAYSIINYATVMRQIYRNWSSNWECILVVVENIETCGGVVTRHIYVTYYIDERRRRQ